MRLSGISLFALALALAATPSVAQDFALDEIVVSAASLTAVEAGGTGASVSVVDAAALRAAGGTRMIDFLERVAGLTTRTQGPMGTQSGFSIRGASQNYVKVTVDGIDVSDPSGTQVSADLGALTTGGAGRVEIVKGSQSAIHGANAIGGVVAITSRRPTEEGTRQYLEAEGGSYGTAALTWGLTHRNDRTEAAVSLSHLRSDGFSAAANGTEADGHRATRLNFHLRHRLENGVTLGANGFLGREVSEYDPQFFRPEAAGTLVRATLQPWGASPDAPSVALGDGQTGDERSTITTAGLRAFAEWESGRFTHSLALTARQIRRHYFENEVGVDFGSFVPDAPGATTGTLLTQNTVSDNTYVGRRIGLSYLATGEIATGLRASFGAEWTNETYRQAGTFGPGAGKVGMGGVFGEVLWSPGERLDVSAALRHDRHSDFGGATTGRVALAFRPSEDVTLRAQAGTGYRAPSSYERFGAFVGNAALRPEKSRSADFGIEKRFAGGASLRATVFWLEVENLIDYSFATSSYAQVPGRSRRQGVELEAQVPLGERVMLGGSYTYLDSTVNAASSWGRQPRHVLGLNLGVDVGERTRAGLGLRHVAGRPGLRDYTLVNALVSHDLGNGAEAWLRLENLFDENYVSVAGYGTPGRSVFVGLRKAF